MAVVFIGVGSNINREQSIHLGVIKLSQQFGHLRRSAIYRSQAVGFNGPDFYNFVVQFETDLELAELAPVLRQIEFDCGRPLHAKKCSSRTLDIDILLYDDLVCEQPCELPRAEIVFNAYVLRPLSELAGELIHPVTQQPLALMWQSMKQNAIPLIRIDDAFLNDSSLVYDDYARNYLVSHSGAY
ncbi:2-amino-4-hydroxy-6-hydroxymethyldihydropteridine diphosphokinase [Celerinatantimonas sp. YJH-8]|uniref:2-amino-4-hydroxy-6- hydroxymethyldihydropteridine diphosphokinase n=1 Tax=Celerinatantimonas sp. YJH-8 TaxID=3228714 RepID=UPI0038C7CCCE